MNSLIYQGEVSHSRLSPVKHSFRYPVYFYAFDIDELNQLAELTPMFGYNRLRPVAIHDKDYLQRDNRPLREKLAVTLRNLDIAEDPTRVILVTAARYFNYVFNPISFFYCYNASGQLLCVLGQVNNTFGEMHLYLLQSDGREAAELHYKTAKEFHVSPFFKREGEYRFHLTEAKEQIDNRIHYHQGDQLVFTARLHGSAKPFNKQNLMHTLIRHPLTASLTMPRILWQAAKLYWQRRLPVYTRPISEHQQTIRQVKPGLLDRLGRTAIYKHLSRQQQGALLMRMPDGEVHRFGAADGDPNQLTIRDDRFFRKVLTASSIGFGEAYTEGYWTTNDLPGLLTMLAINEELIDDRGFVTATLGRWFDFLRHLMRANTRNGSSRNIREHYDLSNDFFAVFLDPDMIYSAALFAQQEKSLEQAQQDKLQLIIDKAQLGPKDHVLEIGCGWGGFAIEAVRRTGCRVTGITLSQEQLTLAREKVKAAGLEKKIDLRLCDYRNIDGKYDKIVSIEMLEAVGHAGLKTFFNTCDRVLQPGGRAVIQVITIPDRKYASYRYSSDWIRKHIFPGGHLPSIGAMANAMKSCSLNISSLEQYAPDYAKTLDLWRGRLLDRQDEILALGYDERFLRKWEYYFAYCRAGFAAQIIDVAQLILDKPQNR
ncbi:MAG: DUF1365 domain-containing protein [Desulfuromonas sp.]|nr:MAG: DUF1365 domain-containing protein [Desulfuromonas sp.]